MDAATVARAFEVALPSHTRGLALSHNEHKEGARSVGPYIDEQKFPTISDVERQKIVETDELWVLYWYAPGDVMEQNRMAAATLPGLFAWLASQDLAFGN